MLTKTAEAELFYRHALESARENAAKAARLVRESETLWAIACDKLNRFELAEALDPEGLEEAEKAEAKAFEAMTEAEEASLAADRVADQCEEAYEAARRFYAALQAFK